MTVEQVNLILKGYRFDVGRCGHLEVELHHLEKGLAAELALITEGAASLQSPVISDMPHGTGISNPTERIGMLVADGWKPEVVKQMEKDIQLLNAEYQTRMRNVKYVDSWLSGLPERERWMIEQQVIDGVFWRDLTALFRIRFGADCSKDTLKRIRERGLMKVYEMAR